MLLQDGKLLFGGDVSVENHLRHGGMVVGVVEVQELSVGEPGDLVRDAAGVVAQEAVGKEAFFQHAAQHGRRAGIVSRHLVVDNAVDGEAPPSLLPGDLVVPSLLPQNLRGQERMEGRVPVDLQQIEVVPGAAGDERIERPVRIGAGVQKGGCAGLQQADKGIFHRKALGALQHRVFHYVGRPRVIHGFRGKAEAEEVLRIVGLQAQDLQAAVVAIALCHEASGGEGGGVREGEHCGLQIRRKWERRGPDGKARIAPSRLKKEPAPPGGATGLSRQKLDYFSSAAGAAASSALASAAGAALAAFTCSSVSTKESRAISVASPMRVPSLMMRVYPPWRSL